MINKNHIENFVIVYMSYINSILNKYSDIYNNDFALNEAINDIRSFRNNKIKKDNMLLENNLPSNFLDDLNSKDKINDIYKALVNLYSQENLKGLPKKQFVKTLFSSELNVEIDESFIIFYKKNIEEFKLKKDVDALYKLTLFSNDNNESLNNTIKTKLEILFKGLQIKDRAEILANLNIFYEQYAQTDLGSHHLTLFKKKYLSDLCTDAKNAEINWMLNIIETASSYSPSKIYKELEINNQSNSINIISKTNSGGKPDGLFFINNTKLNDKDLERLHKIDNLDDFENFKSSIKEISQILICTTTDNSVDIELDSIARHSLGNIFLSTLLNDSVEKDQYFITSFSHNKKNSFKDGNINIRSAIISAFRDHFPEEIDENKNPDEIFNSVQQKILKSPISYINKYISKNLDKINLKRKYDGLQPVDEIKDMFLLTENNLDILLKSSEDNNIFNAKGIVCLYSKNNVSKGRKLNDNDSKVPQIIELSKEEKVILIQYAALLKENLLKEQNKAKIETELCNKFADQCLMLTAYSTTKEISNTKLRKINQDDIDFYVLNTFLLSEHTENNISFLDTSTRKNITKIIEHILNNYIENDKKGKNNKFFDKFNLNIDEIIYNIKKYNDKYLLTHDKLIESFISVIEERKARLSLEINILYYKAIIIQEPQTSIKDYAIISRMFELGISKDLNPTKDKNFLQQLSSDKIIQKLFNMPESDISNSLNLDETEKKSIIKKNKI